MESAGAHIPYWIPVAVRIAFVGDGKVADTTERIGEERDGVASVVEGIQENPEGVVVTYLRRVAPHFSCDPLGGWGGVPDPRSDEETRVIEHDGAFGGRYSLIRHSLNEIRDCGNLAVDWFVEATAELETVGKPERPDCRTATAVACHRGWRYGRRWSVNQPQRVKGGLVLLTCSEGEGRLCAWLTQTLPSQSRPTLAKRVRHGMRVKLAKRETPMSSAVFRVGR